jgi:hypothetical protein
MLLARLARPLLVLAALTLPAFAAADATVAAGECPRAQLADPALGCATVEDTSATGVAAKYCRCLPADAKTGRRAPFSAGVRHEYH